MRHCRIYVLGNLSRIDPVNVLTIVDFIKQRNQDSEFEFYFAEKDFEKQRIKLLRKNYNYFDNNHIICMFALAAAQLYRVAIG